VRELDRRRTALQILTVVAGGAGTILAAAGQEIWIGLTTAIAGAALSHLGLLQVDTTIVNYNQTAAKLESLRDRWHALSPEERNTSTAKANLVERAELALTSELRGWVEQMTEAMREFDEAQAKRDAAKKAAAADPTV
jgi:hypothetical protein